LYFWGNVVAIKVECEHCNARLTLKDESKIGKRIRCPKCKEPFTIAALEDEFLDDLVDFDEEDFAPPPKKRKKTTNKKKGKGKSRNNSSGILLPLLLGGGVLALLLIGGVIFYFMNGDGGAPNVVDNANEPATAPPTTPANEPEATPNGTPAATTPEPTMPPAAPGEDGTSSPSMSEPEETPKPTQPTQPKTPTENLLEDIQSAISMIDDGKIELLAHSFLPLKDQQELKQILINNPNEKDQIQKRLKSFLRPHLAACLTGEITLNRQNTLADLSYTIEPKVTSGRVPDILPLADQEPAGTVIGLGDDLQAMLTEAAVLVNKDLEKFVKSVYPLPFLAKLEDPTAMQQHLERINDPGMIEAMVRDLKDAAGASADISNGVATIKLKPLVKGDSERIIKFQNINGNWRFFDADEAKRQELVQLGSQPIGELRTPGAKGNMIFSHDGTSWRLNSLPNYTETP